MTIRKPIRAALLLLFTLQLALLAFAQGDGVQVSVLQIKGAIGPATTDYVRRGILTAGERGDQAVVLSIDTPGGLDAATRDMNQAILAAPLPVIAYVFPGGARAASAGTYILYASHVAAMAPATSLGAATPVSIMGGGNAGASPKGDAEGKAAAADAGDDIGDDTSTDTDTDTDNATRAPDNVMSRKAINDSVAYIRGLAELRGRNADWAETAVRDAASLTATAALERNVIDLIASNIPELLRAVDGRTIELSGKTVELQTDGAAIAAITPDWRNRILARITDPTVAYLLFIVGLYGLLLEGYNPGVIVPGVVGAIALLLALYAFQVLPINYAGAALIVLGIILIAAESFAPSFGALGIGGISALIIGSLILVDVDLPGYGVSRAVIGGIGGISGLFLMLILGAVMRARRQPVVTGANSLIGKQGVVIDGLGRVHVNGEDWQTDGGQQLVPGDAIQVTGIKGLHLTIEKLKRSE